MVKKASRVVVLAVFLPLLVVACSGVAAAPAKKVLSAEATRGKTLFIPSCASCHGQDARGIPGLAKDLTNSSFVKARSDAELVDFIKRGRPANDPLNTTKVDMPPRGNNPFLTEAQIADIIAFVRTVNH